MTKPSTLLGSIFVFACLFCCNLIAQNPYNLEYKLAHPTIIDPALAVSRTGEPGSSCENSLPLTNGTISIQAVVNTTNDISLSGTCLGTAPNQTWFTFTADTEAPATIFINSGFDVDFVVFDASTLNCDNISDPSFQVGPYVLDCSFSGSANEVANLQVAPDKVYILLVTNYSNQETVISIDVQSNAVISGIQASVLNGNVYADINNNCFRDIDEFPISNALVRVNNTVIFDVTDSLGNYSISIPAYLEGTVSIVPGALSTYWENNCFEQPDNFSFISTDSSITFVNDCALNANFSCGVPSVQSSVPFLRRCFTSARTVEYCNVGTLPISNAIVKLTYDDNIWPVTSSFPYTQVGNIYTFEVGDLNVGQCGSFYTIDSVGCENAIGSYGLVTATIAGFDNCLTVSDLWDGSDLEVTASCSNADSATFIVTNVGLNNMSQATNYSITRNDSAETEGTLQLLAGQSLSFTVANSEDLVIFSIDETANHPFNTSAWAFSDCGTQINFAGSAPGLAIQDQQPWLDQDIELIIGAYDPNDKFAWPIGIFDNNKIEPTDELEFRIRFQNTGNDTAFNIVVIDTLSPYLDYSSLKLETASHAYTYELNDNVLRVSFPNIELPDSSTNLEKSIGYFKFSIKQLESNPITYAIQNFADIYFDFNPPIRTNTTEQNIYIIEEPTSIEKVQENGLKLFPVPAKNELFVDFNDVSQGKFNQIQILDITGRIVQSILINQTIVNLDISSFNSGVYFVRSTNSTGDLLRKSFVVIK